MEALLTVLNDPIEGREDLFNDWYSNVHLPDVMRLAASIRAQRLVASEHQIEPPTHKYFALYDTFDPALLSKGHIDATGTRRMVTATAHDRTRLLSGYYYPVAARSNRPTLLTFDVEPLILERIDVPVADRAEFEDWYAAERMPSLLKAPSHICGTLLRYDPAGQMTERDPGSSHMAIWRVDSLAQSLPAWDQGLAGRFADLKRSVACYEPMAPYLTRDEVIYASPEALHIEETARLRSEHFTATGRDDFARV